MHDASEMMRKSLADADVFLFTNELRDIKNSVVLYMSFVGQGFPERDTETATIRATMGVAIGVKMRPTLGDTVGVTTRAKVRHTMGATIGATLRATRYP